MKHMQSTRNFGIDLLRIFSMFFVVILHVLEHGGITKSLSPFSTSYSIIWFIEIGCYCAVNCYALISGYVGYTAKYKVANIVELYCQTVFYALLVTLVIHQIYPQNLVANDYVKSFFPFSYDTYWFFSCYFCMFFFIPFFNYLVENLEKSKCTALILGLVTMFSIMPTIFNNSIFQINNGFSVLWLSTLYIIGAYIRKYKPFQKVNPLFFLFLYFVITAITWISKIGIEYCSQKFEIELWDSYFLVSYVSPTILLEAITLLLFFSRLSIHNILKKIIAFFTPLVFGVYLIHDHLLTRNLIIHDRFCEYASYSSLKLIVALLVTTFFIWLLCSSIEFVRYKVFQLLKIKQHCLKLEKHIVSKWNNLF